MAALKVAICDCVFALLTDFPLPPSPLHPSQMLGALQLCGPSLDDYLHLLVPPIVKVFEVTTNSNEVRK